MRRVLLSLSCRTTRNALLIDNSCNARVKLFPKRTAAYQYWIPSLWRRRPSAHATWARETVVSSSCTSQGWIRLCVQVVFAPPAMGLRIMPCHEWLGGRALHYNAVASAVYLSRPWPLIVRGAGYPFWNQRYGRVQTDLRPEGEVYVVAHVLFSRSDETPFLHRRLVLRAVASPVNS